MYKSLALLENSLPNIIISFAEQISDYFSSVEYTARKMFLENFPLSFLVRTGCSFTCYLIRNEVTV